MLPALVPAIPLSAVASGSFRALRSRNEHSELNLTITARITRFEQVREHLNPSSTATTMQATFQAAYSAAHCPDSADAAQTNWPPTHRNRYNEGVNLIYSSPYDHLFLFSCVSVNTWSKVRQTSLFRDRQTSYCG
jgi:hypothetical protein